MARIQIAQFTADEKWTLAEWNEMFQKLVNNTAEEVRNTIMLVLEQPDHCEWTWLLITREETAAELAENKARYEQSERDRVRRITENELKEYKRLKEKFGG